MSTARSHVWALSYELSTIEQATVGCATVLANVHDTQGDERSIRARVSEAEAMLTLVHRRLHDLGRVLRGELDPWLLAAPHNVVEHSAGRANPGEEVVFAAWADAPARLSARRSRR